MRETVVPDEQSLDLYNRHLIFDLYRMIEERKGVSQEDVDAFTKRILCGQDLGPVSFTARPDGNQREPLRIYAQSQRNWGSLTKAVKPTSLGIVCV